MASKSRSSLTPIKTRDRIFDCFFAGTIPVYYGAPNVTDFIPENCFVDFRKFKSYDKLFASMQAMTDAEVLNMQKVIFEYLKSEKAQAYSAETFAQTLAENFKLSAPSSKHL